MLMASLAERQLVRLTGAVRLTRQSHDFVNSRLGWDIHRVGDLWVSLAQVAASCESQLEAAVLSHKLPRSVTSRKVESHKQTHVLDFQ